MASGFKLSGLFLGPAARAAAAAALPPAFDAQRCTATCNPAIQVLVVKVGDAVHGVEPHVWHNLVDVESDHGTHVPVGYSGAFV